MIKAIRN